MQGLFIITLFFLSSCSSSHDKSGKQIFTDSISKIEMTLSAFGVESDDFPSINAYIDFKHDSSNCVKSYYNPAYKPSPYSLSLEEIKKILELLENFDLKKLKKEYRVSKTNQPASTMTIYAGQRKFVIKDYGLEGEYPLPELYKIVYRL
jgi:hypothetical protein